MRRPLAAGLLLVAAACAKAPPPLVDEAPAARREAGAGPLQLSLPRHPTGAPWTLAGSRGRVVVLDVWATWCEPCLDALPMYQDIAREFSARGLDVFAISIDEDPGAISRFVDEKRLTLPVLRDPEAKLVGAQLQVKQVPTTFFVDRQGRVRFVHEGFDEALFSTMLAQLEQLLAEPAP